MKKLENFKRLVFKREDYVRTPLFLKKYLLTVSIGFIWLRIDLLAGCCFYGYKQLSHRSFSVHVNFSTIFCF